MDPSQKFGFLAPKQNYQYPPDKQLEKHLGSIILKYPDNTVDIELEDGTYYERVINIAQIEEQAPVNILGAQITVIRDKSGAVTNYLWGDKDNLQKEFVRIIKYRIEDVVVQEVYDSEYGAYVVPRTSIFLNRKHMNEADYVNIVANGDNNSEVMAHFLNSKFHELHISRNIGPRLPEEEKHQPSPQTFPMAKPVIAPVPSYTNPPQPVQPVNVAPETQRITMAKPVINPQSYNAGPDVRPPPVNDALEPQVIVMPRPVIPVATEPSAPEQPEDMQVEHPQSLNSSQAESNDVPQNVDINMAEPDLVPSAGDVPQYFSPDAYASPILNEYTEGKVLAVGDSVSVLLIDGYTIRVEKDCIYAQSTRAQVDVYVDAIIQVISHEGGYFAWLGESQEPQQLGESQQSQGEQMRSGLVVVLSRGGIEVDIGEGNRVSISIENVMSRQTMQPVDRQVFRTLKEKMVEVEGQGEYRAWVD